MTHTAEEVRDLAKQGTDALQTFINGQHALHVPPRDTDPDIVWAKCLSIVDAYAALLERSPVVTDEVAKLLVREFENTPWQLEYWRRWKIALEAVWPVAAEPAQDKCFCDRMYPDSNPNASCGDCPTRDYKAAEPAQPADSGLVMDALRDLVEACETEFCSDGTAAEPDNSKVAYPEDECHITFGHIRRARAALAEHGLPAERDEIAEEAWRAFYRAADKVQKEAQSNG